MSVFGGFSTKENEILYGELIEQLLSLLTWRVMCILREIQMGEEQWQNSFLSVYEKLEFLELSKYSSPKFTRVCSEIHDFLVFDCRRKKEAFRDFQEVKFSISTRHYSRPMVKKCEIIKPLTPETKDTQYEPVSYDILEDSFVQAKIAPVFEGDKFV